MPNTSQLTTRQTFYVRHTVCGKLFHNSGASVLRPELRNALEEEAAGRGKEITISQVLKDAAKAHGNNSPITRSRPRCWVPARLYGLHWPGEIERIEYEIIWNWAEHLMNDNAPQALSDYHVGETTSGKDGRLMIEAHRDEYAVSGTAIIVLKDSLGHGLQVHCNLLNPLKPRDVVMVDPKSCHWVPVASRIADRIIIVLVF